MKKAFTKFYRRTRLLKKDPKVKKRKKKVWQKIFRFGVKPRRNTNQSWHWHSDGINSYV
jgi:hypothetical protein